MTTIPETRRTPRAGTAGVTAGGVLRSEWLKLVTVRSTWWTTAIALVLALGAALLLGTALRPEAGSDAGDLAANGATVGLSFVALVVGVLGALAIGGEYATLQIRSSYTAVPRRWPTLVAKAVVVGGWSFAVGLVVTVGGFGVIAALFGARGATVTVSGPVVGMLLGGAVYLAVVAVFAVGLGALVRASAAGITILAALLFVAPVILGLIAGLTRAEWASTASDYLLPSAGGVLFAMPGGASIELWAAWLALVCWLAAVWVPALVLTQARDV
jgi:ABC-2 type transport system permease protein